MSDYVKSLMAEVKAKHAAQPEFHQAVEEVADSLSIVLDRLCDLAVVPWQCGR